MSLEAKIKAETSELVKETVDYLSDMGVTASSELQGFMEEKTLIAVQAKEEFLTSVAEGKDVNQAQEVFKQTMDYVRSSGIAALASQAINMEMAQTETAKKAMSFVTKILEITGKAAASAIIAAI